MKIHQEKIYSFETKPNGAGPLWCLGSSCIAVADDRIFVSGYETIEDVPPLNCARWILYEKHKNGWKILYRDTEKTREPSPVCIFSDGRLLVSENPFMLEQEASQGVTFPRICEFSPPEYALTGKILFRPCEPVVMVEHSYRNFAADRKTDELILFHNKDYDRAYWNLFDKNGSCTRSGKLYWPWGYDYVKPQRIRICYSNVQLKEKAVYIFGTSDIMEPNPEWRKYKKQLTGREWDYDFRRVFFSYTPDITVEPFRYWVEISNREKTAGNARNCDLLVDDEGIIHLLWMEKSCDERLRARFFADEPLNYSLRYARLKNQKILDLKNIFFFPEGELLPSGIKNINFCWGRFHLTQTGKIYIFASVSGTTATKETTAENWLVELDSTGDIKSKQSVRFEKPFTSFHTAGIRNGTAPSDIIHIYGHIADKNDEMWYGEINIQD